MKSWSSDLCRNLKSFYRGFRNIKEKTYKDMYIVVQSQDKHVISHCEPSEEMKCFQQIFDPGFDYENDKKRVLNILSGTYKEVLNCNNCIELKITCQILLMNNSKYYRIDSFLKKDYYIYLSVDYINHHLINTFTLLNYKKEHYENKDLQNRIGIPLRIVNFADLGDCKEYKHFDVSNGTKFKENLVIKPIQNNEQKTDRYWIGTIDNESFIFENYKYNDPYSRDIVIPNAISGEIYGEYCNSLLIGRYPGKCDKNDEIKMFQSGVDRPEIQPYLIVPKPHKGEYQSKWFIWIVKLLLTGLILAGVIFTLIDDYMAASECQIYAMPKCKEWNGLNCNIYEEPECEKYPSNVDLKRGIYCIAMIFAILYWFKDLNQACLDIFQIKGKYSWKHLSESKRCIVLCECVGFCCCNKTYLNDPEQFDV